MTEVGVIDTPAMERARGRLAVSMLIWTLPQAAAIALAAGRIRLSANWPTEGEHVALYAVTAAQLFFTPIVASRIRWRELPLGMLAALPLSAIAMILGSDSLTFAAELIGVAIAWLLISRSILHFFPEKHQRAGLAGLISILIATAVFVYLAADTKSH